MRNEPATEILYATHRALCEHDADLTTQDTATDADAPRKEFLTTIQGAQTGQVGVDHPPNRLYATTTSDLDTRLCVDDAAGVTR